MHRRSPALARLKALAFAAGVVSALIVPSTASAGTLTVDHGAHSVAYRAAPGETNDVSIYRLSSEYRIQDRGVASVPLNEVGGTLCSAPEPWKYRCPVTSADTASISLGDGADTFDASVSSVAVTLWAGAGPKKITTGSGADTIFARNDSVDQITCGAGADRVQADTQDVVDASCEQVERGTAGGDGTGTAGSPDPLGGTGGDSATGDPAGTNGSGDVFETPVGLTVAIATVPVSNRMALLRLACAADATQACRGDVTIELPVSTKAASRRKATAARGQYLARQRRRGRQLGKRSYRVAPGAQKTVAVRMLRGHYRYISSRRRSRAVMRVTERDPAGKVIDVQTRSITLIPAKSSAGQKEQR
jgi:hypothetical protein